MTTINVYSKEQTDVLLGNKANTTDLPTSSELVPDTTGASVGDVLTVGSSGTEWSTLSSGGITAHTYSNFGELATDLQAHPDGILIYTGGILFGTDTVNKPVQFKIAGGGQCHIYAVEFSPGSTLLYIASQTWYFSTSSTLTSILSNEGNNIQLYSSINFSGSQNRTIEIANIVFYY